MCRAATILADGGRLKAEPGEKKARAGAASDFFSLAAGAAGRAAHHFVEEALGGLLRLAVAYETLDERENLRGDPARRAFDAAALDCFIGLDLGGEDDPAALGPDLDEAATNVLASLGGLFQDPLRHRIYDVLLDGRGHRAGAVERREALDGEEVDDRRVDHQFRVVAVDQEVLELRDLERGDLDDVLTAQAVDAYPLVLGARVLVEAVQKLRTEAGLEAHGHDLVELLVPGVFELLDLRGVQLGGGNILLNGLDHGRVLLAVDRAHAGVGGHDDDGILEVDGAALAVGQAAVV